MLALIVKDLFQNLRTWIVFAGATTLLIILVDNLEIAQSRRALVAGIIEGLSVSSALIFTHTTVNAERKRRHFIFLKSLPLNEYQIILSKFIAVGILSFSMLAIPFVLIPNLEVDVPLDPWSLLAPSFLVYVSTLLTAAICFRNQGALFLPLYLFLALMFISDSVLPKSLEAAIRFALSHPLLIAPCSLIFSLFLALTSVKVFERRELDF